MDPPVDNSADSIANEMLQNDFRNFFESLCTGMNMNGGDQAFNFFCAEVVQFVDKCDCPPGIDKVHCDPNIECPEQGEEVSWDLLLDDLENECKTDFEMTRHALDVKINGGKRRKKLDDKTLDALAKLVERVPSKTKCRSSLLEKRLSHRRSTRGMRSHREDHHHAIGRTDSDPTVEETSTKTLPGDHRKPTAAEEVATPVPVYGKDKLAKEMEKVNFVKSLSTRIGLSRGRTSNTHMKRAPHDFSKSHSFIKRKPPMIAEEDWEYLEEETLSSEKEKADPIIAANSHKKSLSWRPQAVVRKFSMRRSMSTKGKNQFGRYRSFLKRDKVSFDDDGSVQVVFRDH